MTEDRIAQYLIHSYLYYILSDTLISDAMFDGLCQWLRKPKNWRSVESPYKKLILEREGGYKNIKGLEMLEEDYPIELREQAKKLLTDREKD